MSLAFAHRKTTQALNFLAHKSGGKISKLKALKLIFFADRFHLRKYGRPVTECEYFAMEHGPVASEAKNIAEESSHLAPAARHYAREFVRRKGQYDVVAVGKTDSTVLSESDLEALEFAWRYFGKFTKFELRDITHHYPEWQRHEEALKKGHRRVPMDFADFFKEPEAGYIPCHALSDEERKAALTLFRERQSFNQHWS